MEQIQPIPQPLAPKAKPLAAMAELPPWFESGDEPAAPARRQLRRAAPVRTGQAEAVHWSVALLTLFTALSVLLGAFGEARPRELLPIIITSAG